ncbi:MAG: oligopeptide transporter, OPT family [Verrucomicrobia bacterium]|nr:MAG: oligopeptide transporter, OPT family [Verrucomicrobiota bacterium]
MPTQPAQIDPGVTENSPPGEFTVRAVILGALLGIVFGASSLYLVLKVGLTVSASIPVAVISLALFRLWSKAGGRDATILENNIVQTAGSAGESIAFGLGVTMPAIMILGFDLEIGRVMLVGLLGGLLGILMMIPLRRALIVAQHGQLKYPEGTACAQVLKAGAAQGEGSGFRFQDAELNAGMEQKRADEAVRAPTALRASTIFTGLGIGLVYRTLMSALRFWKDTPEKIFGPPFKGGVISAEITPELLGVGYIIGPRISSIMVAGGVLSGLVLTPFIKFFGDALNGPLAPGKKPIAEMNPSDIRSAYVLYIGAGAVAAGGIISLIRSLPIIVHGIRSGLSDFRAAVVAHTGVLRTEQDLSMKFVAGGIVALILAILAAPQLHMNILGAILIIVFGFLFATVSSRLTGEIGSSSNPISGMTVATLLLTCLCFLVVGWTGGAYYVTALSVGGIVCVAASNAGSTSQDLKTGFLIGGTPKHQQVAILIGAAASALVLGPILLGLNDTATVYVPASPGAPEVRDATKLSGLKTEVYPGSPGIGAKIAALFGEKVQLETGAPQKYYVWYQPDTAGGSSTKFLLDASGKAVWLVDPGINGTVTKRPDGTPVHKFLAPKATLMSYIITGMLDRKLPWGLVLFGVMIAVALELCGVSSLAFAVGVYLPISSSTPIFVGGLVRWLVDRRLRHSLREHKLDEAELAAETDKSPGVLLASGYIAGGAIAGILIAFLAGAMPDRDSRINSWAEAKNPFFDGANADWLALLPFLLLTGYLYWVGRQATRAKQSTNGMSLE